MLVNIFYYFPLNLKVLSREAKIKRYKEMKDLQTKLASLSKAMESPNTDESTKREYFTTMLVSYVNQALDELASIEQEKPLLEYMAKHAEGKSADTHSLSPDNIFAVWDSMKITKAENY